MESSYSQNLGRPFPFDCRFVMAFHSTIFEFHPAMEVAVVVYFPFHSILLLLWWRWRRISLRLTGFNLRWAVQRGLLRFTALEKPFLRRPTLLCHLPASQFVN